MKMLVLVFRQSLEKDLLQLLNELDVQSFAQAPIVNGTGKTEPTMHSFSWSEHSGTILAAMEQDQAERVAERLKIFSAIVQRQQHGSTIPLRLFAIPCECLI